MLCSIGYNNIGDTGASALAAILKETMISNLECAATLKVFAFLSAPADTFANTFPSLHTSTRLRKQTLYVAHLSDVSCPFPCRVRPLCHSVCSNNITGDAANHLATVVLEHAAMTDFCGIPLASLRENSITELNLKYKGVGVPGAIVLSKLLPSAAALTSLKCAPARVFAVSTH